MSAAPRAGWIGLLASGAAALAAGGCAAAPDCGEGTYLDGDECRAGLAPRCGPGTRLTSGMCVPDEGGGAICGPGTHLEANTCVADVGVAGNAGRFYEVALTAPAVYVNLANGPLAESFRTGENLLFIGVYAPNLADLRVYGGGGSRSGAGYDLDRSESFDSQVISAGATFATEPFTLRLSAFGATEPIALVDTVVTNGVIAERDGVAMVQSGRLAGVLTPQAADAVYIESANQSLLALTRSLQVPPDVDHDRDGQRESWTMALQFSTTPVWLF